MTDPDKLAADVTRDRMAAQPPFYASSPRFVLGVLAVGISMTALAGCGGSTSTPDGPSPADSAEVRVAKARAENMAFVERVRPRVEAFCGDCHAMPRPESIARNDWPENVNLGFQLYGESGRSDLQVPDYDEVLRFFQYQAPDVVSFPDSISGLPPCPIPFEPEPVRFPGPRPPGVTNVRWLDIGMNDGPALVYCDVHTGAVMAHWPGVGSGRSGQAGSAQGGSAQGGSAQGGSAQGITKRLATLLQPVHTEPCDLDGDGWIDLVVADIGEFNASDSDLGRVVWLRRIPETDRFEPITLWDQISRVADVRPGDFNGDGKLDLLVGIFGWRKTGKISLLINEGLSEAGIPQFREREVDPRPGAINVIPVDFDGDGKLDFVTLLSQEHEVVELFLNRGDATFENHVIWAAPEPSYGSSGIELVDLDGDGDLDVLYTNGDSFDRGPNPHHSVQWLENRGELPFVHHHLCYLPGVIGAKAADFDGDGRLDVVAGALLAGPYRDHFRDTSVASVVVLLQESPGVFRVTALERTSQLHLSVETGDFNGNGKQDIAIGNYLRETGFEAPDLTLWWNR